MTSESKGDFWQETRLFILLMFFSDVVALLLLSNSKVLIMNFLSIKRKFQQISHWVLTHFCMFGSVTKY